MTPKQFGDFVTVMADEKDGIYTKMAMPTGMAKVWYEKFGGCHYDDAVYVLKKYAVENPTNKPPALWELLEMCREELPRHHTYEYAEKCWLWKEFRKDIFREEQREQARRDGIMG